MDMKHIVADRQGSAGRGLKWGPTCLGAFVTIVLQFIVLLIVLAVVSDISEKTAIVILSVAAVVSYIGGGFLAGAMAREKGTSHGLLSAFIAWGSNLILTFLMGGYLLWTLSADNNGFIIGLLVGLVLALGFGALGGFTGAKVRKHWK